MMREPHEISISVTDLAAFVVRGALLAVVLAAVTAAATYYLVQRQPPVFRAQATVLVARTTTGFTQFGLVAVTAPPLDLGAYRIALTSDVVLVDALARLGLSSPTASDMRGLRSSIGSSVELGVRDASVLRVDGRGSTSEIAVARANAAAEALVSWDRRRARDGIDRVTDTLQSQIEALSEQIRALQAMGDAGSSPDQIDGLIRLRAEQQQQLAYARALVASAEGVLSVLQAAGSTVSQIAPRPTLSTAIAALIAVVLAYILLLVRSAFDTKLRSTDDVARVSGLEVLAEFPTAGRHQGSRMREAAGYLRSSLLFATEDVHPRVFMVTSAVEHEGKTTVARHIAEDFVGQGYRTLLVDADLRAPSVLGHYEMIGDVPASASTESWLRDATGPHKILAMTLRDDGRLDLIPQPSPVADAPELLGRGFRAALALWREYDVVVIDTAPVLAVADALAIAPHCTGTIVVVDRRRSDRRKLSAATALLRRVGVRLLGVVANNVGQVGSGGGYGSPYGD